MNSLLAQRIELYKDKSAKDKWESLKFDMCNMAQNYAIEQSSQHQVIISQLYEKLSELEHQISQDACEQKYDLLLRTKEDLARIQEDQTRGIMFRSKAKYVMEAERNTKYFFTLEKAKYNSKVCSTLVDDHGNVVKNQKEILRLQKEFYANLYSANEEVCFAINEPPPVMITKQESEIADNDLTLQELSLALKSMCNDKCPGLDGLSVNFYKFFWKFIGPVLLEAILQGMSENSLHKSALQGIINLIPKANKDTRFLKNLRPITLLNVDYKIIEKALANRR